MKTFRAILEKDDQTSGTGVAMPFDVEKVFGTRGRVPVRGTINGFAFRSTLAPYGGRHYLPVNKALREGAGAQAGDRVEITLERDQEERVVTAPPDLVKALRANKAAQAAWDGLSYTHRREYVESIEEAKKPETRLRRLGNAVEALAAGRRGKR
jgi:bifunctional DNA-binding transcriptional regulator/antitoxin component of YhaV-PrlF toxin-antitoxin module